MLLEGKKALVTGSRRGIGRAIAQLLAREGASVGINDIELDQAAEDTIEMVRAEGGIASWHLADISDGTQVDRMVDEFLSQHGRIDIMVNNAVYAESKPFLETSEADWDKAVGVALKGYFLCSKRAAQEMVNQGEGGSIVSISSVHAFRSWPEDLVYGTCKAGVVRMTKSMAIDLGGTGIRCNCIAPGYIDSRLLPPGQEHLRGGEGHADGPKTWLPTRRSGLPSDIAKAAVFLCSDMSDYVNGECLAVDGGFLAHAPID